MSKLKYQPLPEIQSMIYSHAAAVMTTKDELARFLSSMAANDRVSADNMLLLDMQRPGTTQLAGYQAWSAMGRHVNKGESALTMLKPFLASTDVGPGMEWKTVYVFDVSQTSADGEECEKAEFAPDVIGCIRTMTDCSVLSDPDTAAKPLSKYDAETNTLTLHTDNMTLANVESIHILVQLCLHELDIYDDGLDTSFAADCISYALESIYGHPTSTLLLLDIWTSDESNKTENKCLEFLNKTQRCIHSILSYITDTQAALDFDETAVVNCCLLANKFQTVSQLQELEENSVDTTITDCIERVKNRVNQMSESGYRQLLEDRNGCRIVNYPAYELA